MTTIEIAGLSIPLWAIIAAGVGVIVVVAIILSCCIYWCCCHRRKRSSRGIQPSPSGRTKPEHYKSPSGSAHPSHGPSAYGSANEVRYFVPPPPPPPVKALPPPQDDNKGVAKWEEELKAAMFRKMRLSEIKEATNNFSQQNYVGEGAFAVVYRGKGPGGVPWAVKRTKTELSKGSSGALDFENEVIMISRLSHKNLVRLLGYCTEEGEHLLVYEFVVNGSLGSALQKSKPHLSFDQRIEIAVGIAEALHYLHNAASPPIVHRDIKPDNILIDKNLNAKVADFGLLKNLMEGQETQSVYTRVAGTPGYLDPDYHLTSRITTKGDVYSFGVVLLELFTGKKAIMTKPDSDDNGPIHISSWVAPYVKAGVVDPVADERFGNDYDQKALLQVLETALTCMKTPARSRPDMGPVLRSLTDVRDEVVRGKLADQSVIATEVMDPFSQKIDVVAENMESGISSKSSIRAESPRTLSSSRSGKSRSGRSDSAPQYYQSEKGDSAV